MKNRSFLMLQPRDKELIFYLLKYRVATIYQLMRDLKHAPPRNHFSGRLKRLVQEKYLASYCLNFKLVYSLGKKGQRWLYENAVIQRKYRQQHLGNMPAKTEHDINLNDIYHSLEAITEIRDLKTHNQFILEEQSTEKIKNIPDGRFVISDNGSEVFCALEYEMSLKSESRYQKTFYLYDKDKTTALVLYLAEEVNIKSTLLRFAQSFFKQKRDKIFVATYGEYKNNSLECLFKSPRGIEISIKQILRENIYDILSTQKLWTAPRTVRPNDDSVAIPMS